MRNYFKKPMSCAFLFFLSASLISCDFIEGLFGNSTVKQLAAVENITYDKVNSLLKWDSVEGANRYYIRVNGEDLDTIDGTDNLSFGVALFETTTEFEIKAVDTTDEYLESEWSKPYAVTIDSYVAQVNKFVQNTHNQNDYYLLRNIVTLFPYTNSYDGNHLYTRHVCSSLGNNKRIRMHTYAYSDEDEVTSLKECIGTFTTWSSGGEGADAKDYDTASSFLKRQENGLSYSRELQALVDEGNSISFVTSQAYQYDSRGTIGLDGIVKAETEEFIRYYGVRIYMGGGETDDEEYNYTTYIETSDYIPPESYFIELTGDFKEYAIAVEQMVNE